jgi:hypothetical protein
VGVETLAFLDFVCVDAGFGCSVLAMMGLLGSLRDYSAFNMGRK